MLNVLRESFKSQPYLKVVLLVVAVMLVVTLAGVGYEACSAAPSGEWAARVNGRAIPVRRYLETARNIDQYYRQLFGENYDQFRASLRIERQAIDALVDQEIVLQDAERLGLRSSRAELAEQIRTNPGFLDAAGQFIGNERYREVVERQVTGGVAAFERDLADGLLAAKWASLVTQPVSVADGEIEEAFRRRTEKTSVDYLVFESGAQSPDAAVDESELTAWYESHRDDYRREPGWRIRYVVVARDADRAGAAITDEQIREYYAANQNRFEHPEQRRASHLLFRVEAEADDAARAAARQRAEQALERIRAGADLADLARDLSDDKLSAEQGGDLGFFGRGQMVPAFEEAAFSTAVGELAGLTETPFGFHVIRVTGERPAGVRPLEEVAESVRRALAVEAAEQQVRAEAERLRGEIADAAGLEAAAARAGIAVGAARVSNDGRLPEIGAGQELAAALAAMQPGAISPPIRVATGLALVALDEVLPAGEAPLGEVRDAVRQAVLEERQRHAARAAAERALERHGSAASAAKALGVELRSSGELAPGEGLPAIGGPAPELAARLFGDGPAVGDRGVLAVPAGALLYEISARTPFDPERFAAERDTVRREILEQRREQYRQALLARLRESQKIEINPELLPQSTG